MNKRIYLTENWKFNCISNPTNENKIKTGRNFKAEAPGTIHTDLLKNGLIPDPFYADNEIGLQWISECDWAYETKFDCPASFDVNSPVNLVFEGLDTIADIFLNDEPIGRADNMFRRFQFNVNNYIKSKGNKLKIHFHSPVKWAKDEEAKHGSLPVALRSERVYIRKAQYSFGWDWGPAFITSGIWKPVYLENVINPFIQSWSFNTLDLTSEAAEINIGAKFSARLDGAYSVRVALSDSGGIEILNEVIGLSESESFNSVFHISSPELWFPSGEGSQPLYLLRIELMKDSEVIDFVEKKTGIRKIDLVRNDDNGNTFRFRVNGRDVFTRGVNWIPAHTFLPELKYSDYRRLLELAAGANMNIVRVWGGGIYENDDFYDICDELGLLIWQDFMFACAAYPEHDYFLENIEHEFEENINRIKNHPSIAIWCGNNENEWNWHKEQNRPYTEMPGHKIFAGLIPTLLNKLAPGHNYHVSSPFGEDADPNSQTSGNCHQWEIWSMWTDYKNVIADNSLFVTEFGFQGPANVKTLNSVLPKQSRSIQSPLFEFHNKQVEGNERLIRFLAGHLPLNTDYEDFIYLAQLNQGFALKTCLEHWRANRPVTNGSIIWQLNDCWPVTSWALVDSHQRPKLAYHFVSDCFKNIFTSFVESYGSLQLKVVNDKQDKLEGKIEIIGVMSNSDKLKTLCKEKITLEKSSEKNYTLDDKSAAQFGVIIATIYSREGKIIARNIFNRIPWKYMRLPKAKYNLKSSRKKEQLEITIKSRSMLFFVDLTAGGETADERGFVMLPGEERNISFMSKRNDNKDAKKIHGRTLNDYLRS